jgi:hypothetical protein
MEEEKITATGQGRPARKHWSRAVEPKAVQTEAQTPTVEAQMPQVVVDPLNMTPEEKAIFSRVQAESSDWKTISEDEAVDYSLSRDPYDLPAPAKKLEKEKRFKFRWIVRTPARLDEIRNKQVPFRWWIVNSTQPVGLVFGPFLDPNNGCVSREDQMLVFKPWWMYEKERAFKERLADASAGVEAKDGEKKRASKDTDVEIRAGKRKGTSDEALRQEIRGSDIQFKGESELDAEQGIYHQGVTDSDLNVDT